MRKQINFFPTKKDTYWFCSSDISACNLRCHFSAWLNSCTKSKTFVWAAFISSFSTASFTTTFKPSNISSTSSTVNVSSWSLQINDTPTTWVNPIRSVVEVGKHFEWNKNIKTELTIQYENIIWDQISKNHFQK